MVSTTSITNSGLGYVNLCTTVGLVTPHTSRY